MRANGIIATLVAAVLVACGGPTPAGSAPTSSAAAPAAAGASAPTATPAPASIKAAFSNITGDNLALWVAKEAGLLQQNGLDTEVVSIDGGSRTMAALLSNSVHFAQLGGAEVLSAVAGGADLKVVAILAPVYPYYFMVKKDIKEFSDLRGKKVGISSAGGSADIATRKVLREKGIDPDKDVTIISLGSKAQRTAALAAGSIDAAVDDPPDSVTLEGLGYHSIFDLAGQKLPTANTVVVAQTSYLAANRSIAQRYVDSLVQGISYMRKNKDATIAVMKKYFKGEQADGYGLAYDFFTKEVTPALPYPKAELFKDAQTELGKKNPAVKALDVSKLVDESLVKSAADRKLDQ